MRTAGGFLVEPGEGRTVVVGLSGGVDSAVAAALLQDAGWTVVGATMRVWAGTPAGGTARRHACWGPDEAEDVEDARRVASMLGVAFHEVDLAEAYREAVLADFRAEYARGRTPNPCVRCNRMIKFGALVDTLESSGVGFDRFATGHYVRLVRTPAGRLALRRAVDQRKDQSYFLAQLSQDHLRRALFPLGSLDKETVRAYAAKRGLPVAGKAESQDFASGGADVLRGEDGGPGPVLDAEGREVGSHGGIAAFTVGQRRGIGVAAGKPLYVLAIDPLRNAITVGDRAHAHGRTLRASALNWMGCTGADGGLRVRARIRHNHREADAVVQPAGDGEVEVTFDEPQFAITPGQTVVLYDRAGVVLGAGTIETP